MRLKAALDVQRHEDMSFLESRLRVEMEKQYYELKAQFNHDVWILVIIFFWLSNS